MLNFDKVLSFGKDLNIQKICIVDTNHQYRRNFGVKTVVSILY